MVKQINIGQNSELVQEIFEFLDNLKLLNFTNQPFSDHVVTDDLKIAKDNAWFKVYGEEEYTWSDLRSLKMSEVWDVVYENDENSLIDNQLVLMLDELNDNIFDQLNTRHKELLDDIVSDLKGCIYSRAFQGTDNKYFEEIFSIYLKGGWPCGWKGNWPDGQILVYCP